MDKANDC